MKTPLSSGLISPALQPGDKLGYFEVLEPLPTGGMSLIWKGRDNLLARDVAIKQLADAVHIDEAARERFAALAQIHKKLTAQSARLVKVIDMIAEPRGLFIVMELIDGMSLEQALQRSDSPMDPKQGLNLIYCLAQALKEIHDAGILHRDLKPSNILLNSQGEVKVCDFGLATIIEEQDPLQQGTTRYMAPELFSEGPAEPRADIYALGMVAYEVLAGRSGFDKVFRTVLRDERNQALRWMKWHANPRLTVQPLHTINENVPEPLSDLVARMMEKDPSQRIATADQLIEAIRRNFTAAGKAQVRTASRAAAPAEPLADENPTAPLPKRSLVPILLALNAVILLAIVGGGLYYVKIYQPHKLEQQRIDAGKHQFDLAMQQYDQQKYAPAQQQFQALASVWPPDSWIGQKARIGSILCQGHLLLQAGLENLQNDKLDLALESFRGANQAFEQADAMGAMRNNRNPLVNLIEQADLNRARVQGLIAIRQLIAEGKFFEGREKIRELRELKNLTDLERTKLIELSNQLEQQAAEANIDAVIAQAQEKIRKNQPQQALADLEQAYKKYSTNDKLAKLIDKLSENIRYDAAIDQARTAENAGNLADAVTHYEKANAIRPSTELQAQTRKLRSKMALDEGYKLLAAGNLDAAAQQFIKSNALEPNAAAQEALKQIDVTNRRALLVKQAQADFTAGDFQSAINNARAAQQLRPDPATQQLINSAQLRLFASQGRTLLDSGKLDSAEAELDKALALDPADAQVNAMVEELKDRRIYLSYLKAGDAARAKGLFGDALDNYRKARDKANQSQYLTTDESESRLKNAEYESWVAKARASEAAGQWRAARSQWKSAQSIHETDEVLQGIGRCDEQLNKQG